MMFSAECFINNKLVKTVWICTVRRKGFPKGKDSQRKSLLNWVSQWFVLGRNLKQKELTEKNIFSFLQSLYFSNTIQLMNLKGSISKSEFLISYTLNNYNPITRQNIRNVLKFHS